ncbi:PH domain-containing protein [Mycoplasmatota bacterium WC44]
MGLFNKDITPKQVKKFEKICSKIGPVELELIATNECRDFLAVNDISLHFITNVFGKTEHNVVPFSQISSISVSKVAMKATIKVTATSGKTYSLPTFTKQAASAVEVINKKRES